MSDGTPIRPRRSAPAARVIALATAIAVAAAGGGPVLAPARAQDSTTRGMPVIRDAEIEQLLRDYAQPVLRAAGIAKQNVRVVVLSDRSFNAFVMDGRHIFINAGALFDAKTPNEIIGVFAHETGHLAGGHLQRLREQLASAQTASIIALLAGIGAAVAGARGGAGGADVGAAAILRAAIGDHAIGARLCPDPGRSGRSRRREIPSSAHPASRPKEWSILFKRLSNKALFNSRYIDPYMQTHPMPADRDGRSWKYLPRRAPTGTVRIHPSCNCGMISIARKIIRLPGTAGRTPLNTIIG